jgi:hypothetical protein
MEATMGDSNHHYLSKAQFLFGTDVSDKLALERRRDEEIAKAQAFHAIAYREMPEDLRSQAKVWGVSAIMEAVWMNAWENGYKQAERDRAALSEGRDNG